MKSIRSIDRFIEIIFLGSCISTHFISSIVNSLPKTIILTIAQNEVPTHNRFATFPSFPLVALSTDFVSHSSFASTDDPSTCPEFSSCLSNRTLNLKASSSRPRNAYESARLSNATCVFSYETLFTSYNT
jgi:hypothetical protein